MRTCHFCSITKVAKILLRVTFGCFKIFGGTQVNFSDPISICMLWDSCFAFPVPNQLLLKGVLCTRFGSKRSLICKFSLPNKAKQLSMAATAAVIWLCTCIRYWPCCVVGTCASGHNLFVSCRGETLFSEMQYS